MISITKKRKIFWKTTLKIAVFLFYKDIFIPQISNRYNNKKNSVAHDMSNAVLTMK